MRQGDSAPESGPAPQGCAKQRQILRGARQVFTELGFERASIDVIAARAGVSKVTIYNHYEDKTALFVACVTQDADELRNQFNASLAHPVGGVERSLRHIGETVLRLSLAPSVVALFRHVIAEAPYLPHVGEMIYERGPAVLYEAVAAHLKRWHEAGVLRIDDPHAAAVELVALCQGDLVTRARLGIVDRNAEKVVRTAVRGAVRTFLRAYHPSTSPG